MLYSLLIYDSEAAVDRLSEEELEARIVQHRALQKKLQDSQQLGPVAQLMPTSTALTVRGGSAEPLVLDGPFAETKEQLVGFYLVECETLEEALEAARQLPLETSHIEVRPIVWFDGGALP